MLTPVCINISKHNVNLIYLSALFENIASYLNEKKPNSTPVNFREILQ